MLKTKKVVAAIIASLTCGVSTQAAADEIGPGWYVGTDLGHVELQLEELPNYSNRDLSDSGFAIHGGYRVSQYFAIESTYADLGDFTYRVDLPDGFFGVPEYFPIDIRASGNRLDLALVGSIPLGGRFEAYAKVGLARTELEYKTRTLNNNSRYTDSNSDAIYGIGLRMHFDNSWSLRFQWDRTQLGDYQPDVDALWLGVEYRFGGR